MNMWPEVLEISLLLSVQLGTLPEVKSYAGLSFTSLSEHRQFVSTYPNIAQYVSEAEPKKTLKQTRKVKVFRYTYPPFLQ